MGARGARAEHSVLGSVQRLARDAANAPCELDVLYKQRDALGVDGAEVRVLEERHTVRLATQHTEHTGFGSPNSSTPYI